MSARIAAIGIAIAIAVAHAPGPAHAQPYARDARVAHLDRALAGLRALGADGRRAFELALHDGVRTRCRPGGRRPTTGCMIDVGRAHCATAPDAAACAAAADIVLTNQHAEQDLVDEQTRMRLVRTSSDYHAAVNAELWSRYALVAAELVLFPNRGSEAERIDRFCAERDREVHRCEPGARACVPSLAWQRCAAGLAWYIAADGAPGHKP